jgi:DNA-binding MarR family transcriptional regulator
MSTTREITETWRDLRSRHSRVLIALERALESEHGISATEYDVLEHLSTAKSDQRRMQELSEAVNLSQSALSRLVGRLESEGLVYRAICNEDRRGIFTCLTDEGRARYDAARPTQRRVLAAELDPGH